MSTNPELETERELRIAAEKNYNDLLAFLRGEEPATYCLHVRGHADEIRKLHADALRDALAKLPVDAVTRAALEAIRDDGPHTPTVQTLFGRYLAKALTAK